MQTAADFEAKTYLAEAVQGEDITITKHEQVVAEIVPACSANGISKEEIACRLQEFGNRWFRLESVT